LAAIWAHEKGFYLKNDYYNGINLAFLLDCRAAELGGEDAVADRVQARRLRERVVEICTRLLAKGIRSETEDKKERRNIGNVQRSLRPCSAWKRSPNQTWSLQLPKRQLLNPG
jgi:hypothetical protein